MLRTFLHALHIKLQESVLSVVPIALMVVLLYFTPFVSLTARELSVFLFSTAGLILGISLFNLGADLAMTPMGESIGSGLSKTNRVALLLVIVFIMGFLVTIAEPDLSVLASQVADVVDGTLLKGIIGLGVGLLLLLAVARIIFSKNLAQMLMFFYMLLFSLVAVVILNGNSVFLPLAFDSGGVTTGPITVPFIMALGVGIATTLGGKNQGENSFGLIALCSVGPILAIAALGIVTKGELSYTVPDYSVENGLGEAFWPLIASVANEILIALTCIVASFMVLQVFYLKVSKQKLRQIGVGLVYTFIGLLIFLSSVTIGYMPVGFRLGQQLAETSWMAIVIIGFVVGTLVVLAEPAVHVLNHQVEAITNGTVSKKAMMLALSLGVGASLALSMLRIHYGFSILYYVVPGYLLSLGLSLFVPGLYTAIAFDSGGVASGPLTSGFILPFSVGACSVLQGQGNILDLAFGVVTMVAMTPLITIQVLGFKAIATAGVKRRIAMKQIMTADDDQIIHFM
ncbi:MAG: DUF1538 domain-containing protein [Firmicutes bacterium]|nr:DUF1538 domain-containing protein [Bacillota bacterium]